MNEMIRDILTQPTVITAVAGFFAWLITRVFVAKPGWAKYEGMMITAVRAAEKLVPDDTQNAGLARADAALKAFIDNYKSVYKTEPSARLIDDVRLQLPIVHDMLEDRGAI